MNKELEYINNKIKDIEYRIAHPTEYNLTPTIKVKINDSAVYKEELEILKNIKAKLENTEFNLKRWLILLGKDGMNSKAVVRDEIEAVLEELR